jgi:hypothetical protein
MANKATGNLVLGFAFALLILGTQLANSQASPKSVFIEQFTSRDGVDAEVLSSFRDLFEESFEDTFRNTGVYSVLNRQELEKIVNSSKSEILVTSMEQIDADTKARLRLAKADGVIFGRVIDDKESGEVVVSAKLQSFDSVLQWNKSVTMKRGLIHDRASRKAAMVELVKSVATASRGEFGTEISELEADITLQEDGGPSRPIHIVVTHDVGVATYTATLLSSPMTTGGPTYLRGTLSPDGRVLEFKSALAGTRIVDFDGKVLTTVSGEMALNLKRIPNPSDDSSQSGDLTGAISLTGAVYGTRSQTTLTGHLRGSYKASMAIRN